MTAYLGLVSSSYGQTQGSSLSYSRKYFAFDGIMRATAPYDMTPTGTVLSETAILAGLAALTPPIVLGSTSSFPLVSGSNPMICTNIDCTPDTDGRLQSWTVEVSFVNGNGPGSLTYSSKDMNTVAINVDTWRIGSNAPSSLSSPNDTDIGGTKVDQGGKPISTIVANQELTITNYASTNNAANIRAALGKRNSASYNGASAGYLLFTGGSARRVDIDLYEVSYKMVFDTFAHCRQVPVRDVDGKIQIETPSATGVGSAKLVLWRQPFPSTYDFASIGIIL